jgi:hypothetical protein
MFEFLKKQFYSTNRKKNTVIFVDFGGKEDILSKAEALFLGRGCFVLLGGVTYIF